MGEPVQPYVHPFTKKGSYEILCMEFCGYQHHVMRGVLKVT
jgi:heme/copper-type cytochrome/quinol oxidase subunit 2